VFYIGSDLIYYFIKFSISKVKSTQEVTLHTVEIFMLEIYTIEETTVILTLKVKSD